MSRLRKDIEALALSKKKVNDYDPEDLGENHDDKSSDDTDDEGKPFGDREHYQAVGKSKLRKEHKQPLDPKYDGIAVSRKALASESDDNSFAVDSDEDDDPFAAQSHGSESQDTENTEEQDDGSQLSGDEVAEEDSEFGDIDGDAVLDRGSDEEIKLDTDSDMEDNADSSDLEEEIVDDKEEVSDNENDVPGARGDLKAFLSNDSKNLALGLSQAASADAAKGRAVKKQYQTFDRILDARIKLQKGLIASEELVTQHRAKNFTHDAQEALKEAQESARQVFDTITSFRQSIRDATSSEPVSRKRKRINGDELQTLWEDLQQLEVDSMPVRRATIDKWSSREKAFDSTLANTKARQKFQNTTTQEEQLTSVLDVYITNEQEKHFRSLSTEAEDEEHKTTVSQPPLTFDDTLFYQSLLRDLITTRSATSSAANNLSSGALLPSKLHPSGNKENKKTIDTKASKGRKIRYTVHEKLQNFTAAEGDTGRDTAMWTERGKNEFFGSLFGQDRALVEESDGDEGVSGADAEVEALRLFRT